MDPRNEKGETGNMNNVFFFLVTKAAGEYGGE